MPGVRGRTGPGVTDAFDLAVIGGGTAGLVAAQTAAQKRKRVLLVSDGPLGGECTWNGCVPSKALIEAASVRHIAANADRFGIRVGDVRVDFAAVMDHVHGVINDIARYEDAAHLEAAGVVVRRGRATFVDAHTIAVGDDRFSAEHVVVCTGSRPAIPAIDGLDGVSYLTNETIFDAARAAAPSARARCGSGRARARAGVRAAGDRGRSSSTSRPQFLPREDPEIAAVMRDILASEGVRSPSA